MNMTGFSSKESHSLINYSKLQGAEMFGKKGDEEKLTELAALCGKVNHQLRECRSKFPASSNPKR